jgi:ribonuclease BN (tRNA processing enzyme)
MDHQTPRRIDKFLPAAACRHGGRADRVEAMGDVSVQFLGSGDAFGSGGRLQACVYVRTDATSFLIDCGTTALLSTRIEQAMEVLFPGSSQTQQQFDIKYVELADESTTSLASLSITPYTVLHESGAPAYALRVDCGGKLIAYSGDTGWTDSLTRAADGADLFICETSFFDKKVPFHVDYETLMEHRAGLGCRRLILTHMSNGMLRRLQDLDVETAEDGMRIVV